VSPLERVFTLEIEFYRRLRTQVPGISDARSIHTSYALTSGYEHLIRNIGKVTAVEIDRMRERFTLTSDVRDVVAARDSLCRLLGREKEAQTQEI
jgi:hypothetical protein